MAELPQNRAAPVQVKYSVFHAIVFSSICFPLLLLCFADDVIILDKMLNKKSGLQTEGVELEKCGYLGGRDHRKRLQLHYGEM